MNLWNFSGAVDLYVKFRYFPPPPFPSSAAVSVICGIRRQWVECVFVDQISCFPAVRESELSSVTGGKWCSWTATVCVPHVNDIWIFQKLSTEHVLMALKIWKGHHALNSDSICSHMHGVSRSQMECCQSNREQLFYAPHFRVKKILLVYMVPEWDWRVWVKWEKGNMTGSRLNMETKAHTLQLVSA